MCNRNVVPDRLRLSLDFARRSILQTELDGHTVGIILKQLVRRVQHVRCDLGAVGSPIKVIEGDFEMAGRSLPHAAKRMILADNQRAARL